MIPDPGDLVLNMRFIRIHPTVIPSGPELQGELPYKVPRDFPGYPGDLRFYIGFNRTSIGYYINYRGYRRF